MPVVSQGVITTKMHHHLGQKEKAAEWEGAFAAPAHRVSIAESVVFTNMAGQFSY